MFDALTQALPIAQPCQILVSGIIRAIAVPAGNTFFTDSLPPILTSIPQTQNQPFDLGLERESAELRIVSTSTRSGQYYAARFTAMLHRDAQEWLYQQRYTRFWLILQLENGAFIITGDDALNYRIPEQVYDLQQQMQEQSMKTLTMTARLRKAYTVINPDYIYTPPALPGSNFLLAEDGEALALEDNTLIQLEQ